MNRFTMAGGLVVGLLVGVLAAAAVGAQEETPTPSDVAGEAGGVFGDFKSKLADNLGISEEELDTAIDQTQVDIIDEQLAAGEITQERADELKQRIADGENVPFPFGPRHHHFGRPIAGLLDSAANVLGLEVRDLVGQLQDDKSLNDVAAEQGLSADDFKVQVLADIKAKLDAKVAEGDLTQEMADDYYARISENIDDALNNNDFEGRFPFGPHRGPRFYNEDIDSDSGGEDDSGTTESGLF